MIRLAVIVCMCLIHVGAIAHTDTAAPTFLNKVRPLVYEVVEAKPSASTIRYQIPSRLTRIPIRKRSDKFYSVGTAFSLSNNRYITAAHVLLMGRNSLWGQPELRGIQGNVYRIGNIYKFSLRSDFAEFSLVNGPTRKLSLQVGKNPKNGDRVYVLGNAGGNGIVIHKGSYMPDMPEKQMKNQQWLRFSAPISPGDSGAPLLDNNGNVVGVVLYKSLGGAPAYALPIQSVTDAPTDHAEIVATAPYRFDLFDASVTGVFKPAITLPISLAAFYKQFDSSLHSYWKSQLDALLAENRDDTFPRGPGSDKALYGPAWNASLPALLVRNDSGTWVPTVHPRVALALTNGGRVEIGNVGDNALFHIKKPIAASDAAFFHDPKAVMDMLLRPGTVSRVIAGQKVKVTSLGGLAQASAFIDAFHRHWQIWTWHMAFSNSSLIVFALPVPDGYVGLFRALPAGKQYNFMINMKVMTAFFCAAYKGTLRQWADFLNSRDVLPKTLEDLRIVYAQGGHFSYESKNISFRITPEVMKISKYSDLKLGFGYQPSDPNKMDVSNIVITGTSSKDSLQIVRHVVPPTSFKGTIGKTWQNILHRNGLFDGLVHTSNGVSKVSNVTAAGCGMSSQGCSHPRIYYTTSMASSSRRSLKPELAIFESRLVVH